MDILRWILLASFALSVACASPTKGMTPDEVVAYEIKVAYEREDKRLRAREELHDFVRDCKLDSKILVFTGRGHIGKIAHVRMDGTVYLPKRARKHDYQCGTAAEVRRALRDAGYGFH